MKRALAATMLTCACSASPTVPSPVTLALAPKTHERTLAERKAAACEREHLAAVGASWFPPTATSSGREAVGKVSVADSAGHAVDVTKDVVAPIHVGSPLSLEDAREVGRRLWKLGRFDDISIETPSEGGRVTVVFRVEMRATIGQVFSNTTDTDALHLAPGVIYDPVAIVSSGVAFGESYVHRGYPDAKLSFSSEFTDETHRTVDVCIRFDTGPLVTLDAIDVRGSSHSAALASLLAREDTVNVHGAVLDTNVLERDELVLGAWLYDQGLLEQKVERKYERHGDLLTVVLQVTDGVVYRYGNIDVRGDLLAPKAEYTKLVTEKRGDTFSRSVTMKTLADIKALHAAMGREDVEVEPNVELDVAKRTATLLITVRDPHKH